MKCTPPPGILWFSLSICADGKVRVAGTSHVSIPVGHGPEGSGTKVLFWPLRHTLAHTGGVTGPERTKAPMMKDPTETGFD